MPGGEVLSSRYAWLEIPQDFQEQDGHMVKPDPPFAGIWQFSMFSRRPQLFLLGWMRQTAATISRLAEMPIAI